MRIAQQENVNNTLVNCYEAIYNFKKSFYIIQKVFIVNRISMYFWPANLFILKNWYFCLRMKTQIAQLKNEKRDVKKAAQLVQTISEQLKEDQLLLQPYLETVLTSVLPTFGNLFPVDVKINCIDLWLFSPEFSVLSIIVSGLKSASSKQVSIKYLKKWTKKKLFSRSIDIARDRQDEELFNEVLAVIFSIPDRVASALEDKPIPTPLKRDQFFQILSLSLNSICSVLLSKYAVLNLMQFLWSRNFTPVEIASAATNLNPSATSPFLLSLIEDSPKSFASSVLAVIYPNNPRVKQLISSHFLTQKVLSDHALYLIVDFLCGQGESLQTLEKCGEIWSRHRLITQMSTALHRQLSLAMLRIIPRTTQDQLKSCKATSLIMTGVSAHISISSPEIRKFGLQIGETITAILLPENPVKFDELHQNEEEEDNENNNTKSELASRKPLNQLSDDDSSEDVDIDAPFDEAQNDDDDSSEDLTPYAIDDDEGCDDMKVLHPRELIAQFRTDENDIDRFKKFQTAISTAADIIKKMTQHELTQFGGELLSILLSVDNEYNQDEFDDMRRQALVALMTTFPVPVAKMVIGELRKKRTHSLGRKLQLISAISYAASEMSELPRPEKKTVTLIEAHTRRWGRARTKITVVSAVNKFSQCALIYFYGILNAMDLEKIALEEDGLEAAQTLTTLAVIVEAAGQSVLELDRMCADLLQVVMVLSGTRAPNARRANLFAASCAIREIKEYRANDEIGEYLVNSAENDPDEICREIAQSTCALLAQRHENDLNNLIPGAAEMQ
ncbi:hypothetical protein TRFO_04464 [Tritrichomonas foetus]|uniref:Telomere length regulation protein conserved domain-containing protein n=1 Tax=Tritrichomonas foetus TaxID=1144522 RepID=A0A1J4KKL6_9EUKA|nr:hypothetical protein TRFO_04464 [Tritrichomonas foetus]|eukprot:OHT09909.1 hypothetical protein TRFO_04464 [Tritrichomonas foetus]